MEGRAVVVCIVVGILGLISTGVGVVFAVTPNKKLVHLFYFSLSYVYCETSSCLDKCVYFRSPAFFLVAGAIICVFIAQIIISISADCGCGSGTYSSSASPALAILAFVLSWLACIAAIILYLLCGATQSGVQLPSGNIFSNLHNISVDNKHCYKVKRGIFAGAAVSSLGAVILGLISYLVLVSGNARRRRELRNTIDHYNSRRRHDDDPSPTDMPMAISSPYVTTRPIPTLQQSARIIQASPRPAQTPVMVAA